MTDRSLPLARAAAGLLLALSAIALSGCTASSASYAVLDRDAEPADTVPDGVIEQDSGDVADLSSARFVGEHSGSSVWLLRGVEPSTVCVLAYLDESEWGMGCGGERGPVEMSGPAGHFTTVPDDYPTPDGATRISDNVYALSP
ncbi:hypothetical protein [Microbacterium sp. MYb66]|jgi:hypothetical protein|uniref:hypothetical protein n=1 Tax=Microbacterium sp. MYb66 TaxID=1848692 RepID=UPI000CFFE9D1|nr:hypothetical protein [Microbacterium sp. MYb66]PRA80639.1 hypothetical protein CQ045_10230 [Microbacterium sp. MYb66]